MKKFILLLVVCLTLLPLFKPGFFDVHDPTSIVRIATLSDTLKAGQFPAAWTNQLNEGFGYPLFLYYAPVFSYLGAFIKLFVPSYLLSLKLSLFILVGVAALGMYKLMRQFLGSYGALIASVSYTLLPYHASTLYVRGSYAEGVTWTLLPWLLYFWSQKDRGYKWIVSTSLITSLFFLSHNSLPFAFIPFLLIWIFIFKPKTLGSSALALILSVGASSWFLLPVIFERGLVQIDKVALLTKYSDHFLSPMQLWHSTWGYGGSASTGQIDGMSFMLGKFQLVLAAISLVYLGIKKSLDKIVIFFLATFIFYAFMTTMFSSFVWDLVSPLQILQFPWRLITFASFAVAALAGYFVEFLPKFTKPLAVLFITCGILFFNLKFFVPQRAISYDDSSFLSKEKLATVARDKIPEYLPASMPAFPTTSLSDSLSRTSTSVYGSLVTSESAPLTISTAYMPQWQLKINESIVQVKASQDGRITTTTDVPAGSLKVDLSWHRTIVENIGIWLSAFSLLVMIGLLFI